MLYYFFYFKEIRTGFAIKRPFLAAAAQRYGQFIGMAVDL
jgi:hypothetical protein